MPLTLGLIAAAAGLTACSANTSSLEPQSSLNGAFAANKALGRGINMGNMLEAPSEGEWGVKLDHSYFKLVKQAGFQSVRIPIKWSSRTSATAPYKIQPEFLARVDKALDAALKEKLFVVINVHHFDEMNAKPAQELPRLLAMWKQIAERFKNRPASVYFELFNEPHAAFTPATWNEFLPKVIEVIRASNPSRMLVVGPANWNNFRSLKDLALPADPNVIITVHYYDPFQFTHQGAEWVNGADAWKDKTWRETPAELAALRKDMDEIAAWSRANTKPIYIGEFGAYSKADMTSRAMWTRAMVREMEARGFSWAYWELASGFGAYDPAAKKWRPELKKALTGK